MDNMEAFATKWTGVPLNTQGKLTLFEMDQQRMIRGQNPLTASQTQRAIQAADTRQPVTPEYSRESGNPLLDFFSKKNWETDITDMVKGIPQLPMALVNEFNAVTSGEFEPVKQAGDFLNLPGIRLLPGSYVGSGLLPGGVPAGELATRPVSSILDVLPFGQYAARANVGRALRSNAIRPDAPSVTPKTYSAGQHAQEILRRAPQGSLSRWDKIGLQGAVAESQGQRLIPSMIGQQAVEGIGVLERPWVTTLAAQPRYQNLMQFAPRTRSGKSLIGRIEADFAVKAREQQSFTSGKAFSERMELEFGDEAAAMNEELHRALTDAPSFGVLTTEEALAKLPANLRKHADEYIRIMEEELQPELLDATIKGTKDPYVQKWRDGQIYNNDQHARLERAFGERQAFIDEVDGSQLAELNAAVDAVYPGMAAAARKGLYGFIEAEWGPSARRMAESYSKFADELEAVGRGEYTKVNTGHLRRSIKDSDNYGVRAAMRKAMKARTKARHGMRRWEETRTRIRPATESPLGSRRLKEKYFENLQIAQKVKAANPEAVARYKHLARMMDEINEDLPSGRRDGQSNADRRRELTLEAGDLRRELQAELGADYRYMHYTVPGEINWIPWEEAMARQEITHLIRPEEKSKLYREIRTELRELSDRGFDPIYTPGVAIERAANINATTVRRSYMKPAFANERSFDFTPMHPDLGVNIAYTGMQDYMARTAIPYMVRSIDEAFGIDELTMKRLLHSKASATYARMGGMHKGKPVTPKEFEQQYVTGMLDDKTGRFQVYDPNAVFGITDGSLNMQKRNKIYLPREIAEVISTSFRSQDNFFQQLFEPVTNTFRVSVLLFAPAWQWNNLFSNALVTSLANPRAWGYVGREWEKMGGWAGLAREMRTAKLSDTGLEAAERAGHGQKFSKAQIESGFRGITGNVENYAIDLSDAKGVAVLQNNAARWQTASRILDQIQGTKGAELASSAFHKITSGSLGLNAFFDDLARRTNFEAFYDENMAKLAKEIDEGSTAAGIQSLADREAIAMGRALQSTQDWIMDWTQLLPVERGILRAIFPFYSFMSHIMRAALKFPFDHPVRVAIINNFTRAEMEDWQSGLPMVFRTLLGMPVDDETDEMGGIYVDAFNPFRDVGNYLTIGFALSSTNPIIAEVLNQAGVDTMSGGPEYAPNFVYDPTARSGQAYDGAGNPIINLAKNIFPQAESISRWMGLDADFREWERSDPDSARQALLTGLRLPKVWDTIDVNRQVAKDEIKRFDDYRKAVTSLDVARVHRYDPAKASVVQQWADQKKVLEDATGMAAPPVPREMSAAIVESGGGPPWNPLSAFVTV